ncbi:hypothetical protein JVT61DRAFT_11105 [Boletus reticuloceps]|uniref:Uncharacterized protein n=1 Tax=Boletus reticuloceps TaxID=495285 RepID=A0A8I2YET3_9AGAM|nr:hypothetical protein JVT61DRAFT_11105 [Boletus reticuloceps]
MATLTDADKREIGQHFVFGFHGHEISEDAKTLIRDYHVGNIILMKRNVTGIKQVHGLVKSLQQFAKDCGHTRPLMIGIDQENGLVSAFSSTPRYTAGTQFPGAMALAATGDPGIARACSLATAKEMKLAGINWAYSPVADVNSDHRNPVIGVRSFGDDAHEVAKYAVEVSDGLTEGGIAPSAKHFPGHGDTHVDSHLALPVIKKSEGELHETELVPFRALIEAGVATIMTGHMALPMVVGEQDKETPCSCSRTVTTGLLREQLGFKGVVVTDCLEMDAVAAKYTSEKGAVMSLQAGADVVMICHTMGLQTGAIEETYKAVSKGELSLAALRESGRRIEALKTRFAGTWENVFGEMDDTRLAGLLEAHAKLSERAYGASTAIIRGPLPKVGPGPVLVLTPEVESVNKAVDDAEEKNTAGPHYVAFAASVQRRRESTRHMVYSRDEDEVRAEVVDAVKEAVLVIFVTRNADRGEWQVRYLREVGLHGTEVVVVASCGPYDLVDAADVSYGCVGSFEYTPAALEAAAGVVFGEREMSRVLLQKFFARDKQKPAKVTALIDAPIDLPSSLSQDAISAHHGAFAPPTHPRPVQRPSADDHWEVLPEDATRVPSPRSQHQQFIAPVIPSRSSSLASLPQPANSPQLPTVVPNSPRSTSPFSTSNLQVNRNQRTDDRTARKRSPPIPGLGSPSGAPPESSDDHHTSTDPLRIEKDKKERKGFWDGMLRDRDKEKWKAEKEKERDRDRLDRIRDRDRREDDNGTAELTRMIGYLTATASEDWSIVLEVCERASTNEANAKEAARALRREFKYAEPKAQLAAARLWAIMLRNASDVFIQQISQRKFIDALEDVLTSPRTSPVVRERLMEVLAAAAFITSSRFQSVGKDKDKDGFRALWCRLKPADKPDSGVPFDTEDAMFSPPVVSLPRPLSQYSLETPIFAQSFSRDALSPTPPPPVHPSSRGRYQQRVIPPEEDMQRLFQECRIARGNADLLFQSLAYAGPDALDAGLIVEFLNKCRASQELIYTQIPWASAGAERSRADKAAHQHPRTQDLIVANTEDAPNELTTEEKLLAALLDANETLVAALRMYDDLARVASEQATEEKSKKDIRMELNDDFIAEPPAAYTGSSNAPSPPLPSPTFELPPVVPSPNHPLPRIPPSLAPSTNQPPSFHYGSQTNTPTLLVPPHPLGPRSPQIMTTSRTPSPDRISGRPSRQGSGDSEKVSISDAVEKLNIEDDMSYSDDDIRTPIRPSAKALGKRRGYEEPDDGESNTAFFGKTDSHRYSTAESDSDDAAFLPKRQPTRYVYDAAAERTAQHLREGHLVNDLYDDGFTVPLDDEYQSPVEPAPSSTPDKPSESTPTTVTSPTNVKAEPSGTGTLPAKPATPESLGLSYSAQVAKQFSAYQQTPSQERQQRTALPPIPQPGPSAIATHEGSADRNAQGRPIRPSEMKDEGKMFIGGLNWDTTDDGLRKYFLEFGKVDACTIMRDPDGRSRGFAFLTFEDPESVNAVLARDHVLDGKSIDPKRAIPREEHLRNTRYFVGGLSPSTTADSMREFFSTFGKIVDATVMVDRDSGRSKGFGFITFEDAMNSDQFVGKLGLILDDKQIEVKAAQPRSQRDQARNVAATRDAYFNDQESRTPSAPILALNAPQAGNPAASMLYQRMMHQMPPMGGTPGMNMMNPMMMGMPMGMGGMGGMSGMHNMGGGMGGGMGGMNGVVGMNGMGGMGMLGGMGPMGGGINPMAMRMGMNGPMGMGMMGQPGTAMGMGNVGMRMRQGMGMGMGGGGGGGAMGVGAGVGANAGRMPMNAGLGPSRMSTRGQHAFHPYAR